MAKIRALLLVAALANCGGPAVTPPTRTPEQRATDSAGAVTALKSSKFDEAAKQSAAALSLDTRSSTAAAVHAIATYQAAGNTLYSNLESIIRGDGFMKLLDHEAGRATWQKFADSLAIVDADLAVVAADPAWTLELCIACWEHDWNHSGEIDDRDRKMFEIEYDPHSTRKSEWDETEIDYDIPDGDPRRRPTFKFDVGDAEWARAMIDFQRAFVELVLAYDWKDIDRVFKDDESLKNAKIVIRVADAARVKKARELIIAGLDAAERCRKAYLAETDDDREWVPNPQQKSHPVPLDADFALYETWSNSVADLRDMLNSQTGLSVKKVAALGDRDLPDLVPDAYIDFGAMLREPQDIVIDVALVERMDHNPDPATTRGIAAQMLKNIVGKGYKDKMKSSPIVDRLHRMKADLDNGSDTFERKLRYLLWLN